jgi:hypothetical protein
MEDKQEADSKWPAIGWKEQESESESERKEDVWIGDCRVWTESAECETGICTEL